MMSRHPIFHLLYLIQQGLSIPLIDFTLGSIVIEGMLDIHTVSLQGISGLDTLSHLLILIFEFFSLLYQSFYLLLGQTALIICDSDLSISIGGLISGLDVHDTICVDLEGNFDLGYTTRGRRNTIEIELTQQVVISGHLSLSLEDLNEHTRLVVTVCSEDL